MALEPSPPRYCEKLSRSPENIWSTFPGCLAIGWGTLLLGITLIDRAGEIFQHRLSIFSANEIDDIIVPLLELFIDLAAGRLVVRLYKPHQKLVVGAFAISILAVWDLPWLCAIATDASHLAEGLFFTFLWTASVWCGGLCSVKVERWWVIERIAMVGSARISSPFSWAMRFASAMRSAMGRGRQGQRSSQNDGPSFLAERYLCRQSRVDCL